MSLVDFLDYPALAPPNGTQSNFVDPENKTPMVVAFTSIFLGISTVAILLQAYTRFAIAKSVAITDFLAFIGYVFFVLFIACMYVMAHGVGFYVHQWNIRIRDANTLFFWIHLSECFYAGSVMTLKMAILLQWVKIFAPHGISKYFSRICYLLVVINALFYPTYILALAFSCRPLARVWNITLAGHCFDTAAMDVSTATCSLLSDIIILLLPQNVIWRLQMTRQRKIGISIIFGTGIVCVTCATGRLASTIIYYLSPDITHNLSAVAVWCLAEITCIILVFCSPAVHRLGRESAIVQKLLSSLQSWRGSGSRSTVGKNVSADTAAKSKTGPYHQLHVPMTSLPSSQERLQDYNVAAYHDGDGSAEAEKYQGKILRTTEYRTARAVV